MNPIRRAIRANIASQRRAYLVANRMPKPITISVEDALASCEEMNFRPVTMRNDYRGTCNPDAGEVASTGHQI